MGLASTAVPRRSLFVGLAADSLVPVSAWLTVALAIVLGGSLLLFGWRDLWFVLIAPSPQGIGGAVLRSLALLVLALPATTIVGFCTAACVWDRRIGGRATDALMAWLPFATGLPPVVAGCAVYFACIFFGWRLSLGSGALALLVLNAPAAGARMLRTLQLTPRALQAAAAALGAGPVFVLFRVALPRAGRELSAGILQTAAELIGQAAALILAMGISNDRDPLPVQIWHYAPNNSLAPVEAAQCIALLALVLVFALAADAVSAHPRHQAHNP